MPTPYVTKLAKKHNMSVEKAEQHWNMAKQQAAKQKRANDFQYITGIFKHMMGESSEPTPTISALSFKDFLKFSKSDEAYEDKYENETPIGPSMETIKARHKAALSKKCSCGKLKDPTEVKQVGSRKWISCHRCLGQIKQLS